MGNDRTIKDECVASAAPDNIRRILGALDEAKLLDILALRPTVIWRTSTQKMLLNIRNRMLGQIFVDFGNDLLFYVHMKSVP